MAVLNFADLAGRFPADEPCGADLEEDADFQNVVARLEVALPTSYFRRDDEGLQVPFDRSSIDFPTAFADLGKQLARTLDVRLFVLAGKLSLLNRDLASFAASLTALAEQLAEHWDAVHPRPQDGDAILREVALQSLDDMATVVLPLQHAPLVTTRRLGPLAFRSQLVAAGEVRQVEGEQHPEANAIQSALAEVDAADLAAAHERVTAASDALRRIVAVWAERAGGQGPACPRLAALLDKIAAFLDAALARRDPARAAAAQAAAPAGGDAATPAVAMQGDCAGIADVRQALAACLDYFRRTEPSSPAVLLIGQAQHLIGKSLFEVVQIMFPEHVDKAILEFGQRVRFQLPLERLASVEPPPEDSADGYGYPQEDEPAEEAETSGGSEGAAAAEPVPQAPLVTTRADAIARMTAVARFYRRVEPSHPTPLLMDKACALAQQDFMTLLGAILPEVGIRDEDAG